MLLKTATALMIRNMTKSPKPAKRTEAKLLTTVLMTLMKVMMAMTVILDDSVDDKKDVDVGFHTLTQALPHVTAAMTFSQLPNPSFFPDPHP